MNTINTNNLQLIELDLDGNIAYFHVKGTENSFTVDFYYETYPEDNYLYDDRAGGLGSVGSQFEVVNFIDIENISHLYDSEENSLGEVSIDKKALESLLESEINAII